MEVFTGEETDRPRCLNEYEKLVIRMNNTPRVVIDNAVCPTATLVKIDSARKHGILLEAVQLLTELRLSINKAYISSDGRWFMDVFHVTDHLGRKLTDENLISVIEQSLGECELERRSNVDDGLTALELTGADRAGLLSEVFAVLADLKCGVADAKLWSHNGRIGSLIFIYDDENPGSPIDDPNKIRVIESRLRHVLDPHDPRAAGIAISVAAVAHGDRRLHQMMFADRDYEPASASPPSVSVQKWVERGYSVVGVQCRDRPKLLFDVVCTLTDMRYIVFHGTVDTDGDRARQEFYIRHSDGSPISSEAEKQRVIKCLQAAIDRRSSEGMRLELRAANRPGLLSDVTRTFRENGLLVRRAEVSTKDQSAYNVFYVTDAGGQPVDPKTIDAVQLRIGADCLQVVTEEKRPPSANQKPAGGWEDGPTGRIGLFYLGSLVMRNLYNLGIIRSCS